MNKKRDVVDYEVIVVGGGSAGVAAALAVAKQGVKPLLIESSPLLGGDLLSGLPIDGCMNARGEWIVGGIPREIFAACDARGGYIGPVCDFRALWVVCIDPIVMQTALFDLVNEAGIDLLLNSWADGVEMNQDRIEGVYVTNKSGRTFYRAKIFIDCSGDGDIAMWAGAPTEQGGKNSDDLQPVSLVYRLDHVDFKGLLDFVRANPDNVGLGESPWIAENKSKEELIEALYAQALPKVFFIGDGPLLTDAINEGKLEPCSMLAVTPNSIKRKSVSINSNRIVVDATKVDRLSKGVFNLYKQMNKGVKFLIEEVPGFENAYLSAIAPKIGVRETRRVMGEYVLEATDVLEAVKREDGVAKGGHEYDVHGEGKEHIRLQLKDGGSYDIPFNALIPKNVSNLLMAGRLLSSTREAHSSARVMGTCMAMGQAVGTAASMCVNKALLPRLLDVQELRAKLRALGAVLEGTY